MLPWHCLNYPNCKHTANLSSRWWVLSCHGPTSSLRSPTPTEKRWEGCWSASELRKNKTKGQILQFRPPTSLLMTWPGPSIKLLARKGFQKFHFYNLPENSTAPTVFVDQLLQVCQRIHYNIVDNDTVLWLHPWEQIQALQQHEESSNPSSHLSGRSCHPTATPKPQISVSTHLPLDTGSSPPRRLADATEFCMVPWAPRGSYCPRAVSTNKRTGP